MKYRGATRIVCLTEETTEALYVMNEQNRIVGISGFTVRPARARKEKPKVSAFTSAKIDQIVKQRPDLVLLFSDMQANITADLVRANLQVHVFNQRTIDEIFQMLHTLGALIGEPDKAARLVTHYQEGLDRYKALASRYRKKPRVYFEEWNDPLISGIGWVTELIEIVGGIDCFPELSSRPAGKDRIIPDPSWVIARQPDIIIGSWCGKKFRPEHVAAREGWAGIPAVQHGQIFEIKSADILQPGPAALTDGVRQLHKLIDAWCRAYGKDAL